MSLKDKIEDIFPLTPLQQGLLFHSLYERESAVYFEQLNCRLEGNISVDTVNQAWQILIDRHGILRTAIVTKGQAEPVQVVFRNIVFKVAENDWRSLSTSAQDKRLLEFLEEDRRKGFALNRSPLLRVILIRLDEQSWQFVCSYHHLLLDGWSMPLLMREFFLLHKAACEGVKISLPPVRPYSDFLAWLKQKSSHEGEAFWRQELSGLQQTTSLGLKSAKFGQEADIADDQTKQRTLSQEIYTQLLAYARQNQVTLNTLVQAAWSILLSRYSSCDEVVFGITVSGRPPELPGSGEIIGLFINTLPLRVKLDAASSLKHWLQELRDRTSQINQYSFSSLVNIQGWSDIPRGQPLFESIVIYENYPVEESLRQNQGEISVRSIETLEKTHYPVTLYALPSEDLTLKVAFQKHVASDEERQQLIDRLVQILERFADRPEFIGDIGLLSKTEESNFYKRACGESKQHTTATVQELFSQQVTLTPDAPAVLSGTNWLTYEELERKSNQFAHVLRELGVTRETLVAVCLERHAGLPIALLGILKAGAAYVPLDPAFPRDRLDFMLADSGAALIVTENTIVSQIPQTSAKVLLLDKEAQSLSQQPDTALPAIAGNQHLAYVIYTSGSTGRPKGVQISHAALVNFLLSFKEKPGLSAADTLVAVTTLCFDISILELFLPLIGGARLIVADQQTARDGSKLAQLLKRSQATVMQATPTTWRLLLAAGWRPNNAFRAFCGGEAMPVDLAASLLNNGVELWNFYGPTETTIWSAVNLVKQAESALSIGQGIANTSVYILDKAGHPLPKGLVGELFIGGNGLARNYRRKPSLTALAFVPNPFSQEPGERLYRTGDLARFLSNGEIEFLGRSDFQTKIRGFRIEIKEIEVAISEFPSVQQKIVVVDSGEDNEKQLVAYIVCAPGTKPTIEALRNHLQQRLPDYMVPSQFVFLDKFPLTLNGKIDRKALPKAEINRENLQLAFVSPQTPEEQILAKIWQKVLRVDRVGRFDNYFVLGGDSIRSIHVCSLADEANFKLTLEQVFSHPVLADLAASMQAETKKVAHKVIQEKPFALIALEDREKLQDVAQDAYPLAQLQAGMLFHSDFDEGAKTYNDLFSFRIRIPFDLNIWQQAYTQMFDRYPILRTAFDLGKFSQPLQVILKEVPTQILFEDLTSLPESKQENYLNSFIDKERGNGFDWSKAPLMRFYIHLLDRNIVQATFALHHAIVDGWSLTNFITEFTGLYLHLIGAKVPVPQAPPALQYSRFIALEQKALTDDSQRLFWQKQLQEIPFTQVPRLNGAVSQNAPRRMAKIDTKLPTEISQSLKAVSKQLGVPLRTVLLAVHMRLLAYCSGEKEVVTGLVSNGRPTELDGDRVLGLFLNTLPFRLKLPRGSWVNLIQETFSAEQAIMPNRRFPFAEIQRMHGNQPLYESSFNFVHFHVYKGLLGLRDVELIQAQSFAETNIPFSVSWSEEVDSPDLVFNITYDSNDFNGEQATAYANYCVQMCAALATNPQGNFAGYEDVGVLTSCTQLNITPSLVAEMELEGGVPGLVHEIFEQQAANSPNSPAVTSDSETWTSHKLNQKANQLARILRSRQIGADKPVGICLERSLLMVVAILAVLKAGGCYVPIDPDYPPARIQGMIEDAKASIILTRSDLGDNLFDNSSAQLVFLDHYSESIAAQSSENLEIPILGEHLAYIIFTSGSTGRAKGIAISHQAIAHHMAWFLDIFAVNSSDTIFQKTPFSFDASVWEFWAALMSGAKLVIAKPGGHQDNAYLVETIKLENVTILQVVPTLLEVLVAEPGLSECSSLRLVFAGGEALKKRVWDEFNGTLSIPLINLYGPAETTIDTAFHRCRERENTVTIPLGNPVPDTSLYILDSDRLPVPIGTPGESFIAGPQLARGYWEQPKLTAEYFLPDPFSSNPGSRMYRTGDRARYLMDGKIEFLGRLDTQLKIRGFRIETSEIVKILESHPWVVRAVTKAISSPDKPTRLVAYVECKASPENWQEILRSQVRNALPEYMIPSLFVSLDSFPLLPNGKINLNALPDPQSEETAVRRNYVAPRNDTENILKNIWQEVLHVSNVGIEDDFFELGGDSILCLQIIAKARAVGIHFTPRDLFNHLCIAELTTCVNISQAKPAASLIPVVGEIPLTTMQQWFFQQSLPHPEHWNQAILLDLKQKFATGQVRTALVQIAESHQAFSLRFRKTTKGWTQQLVDDANILGFDVVNLTNQSSEELSERLQTTASEFQAKLDLESGPLFRAVYFQTDENTTDKLLLIIHHLIVDGVSWRIILQDLAISLTAPLAKQENLSASFPQWAMQLNFLKQNSLWEQHLPFWEMQQVESPTLPLDFPEELQNNKENSAAQIECNFSNSETESLLYELPRTRKARIQEVLLAVLQDAVTEWTGESKMVVALESHGRENQFTEVDVFNSVGWFTSIFPFKLEKRTDDLLENLQTVKEQLRKLPDNGFSYGILRQKPELTPILPKIPAGIVFNYLGQFDDNFPEAAPFVPSSADSGISRNLEGMRPFQLEVTGLIVNSQLHIRFVYSKALHREETIRHLADSFYTGFVKLLAESRSKPQNWTPADFPLAAVNNEQLSMALAGTSGVEDIYPLAPVQEGMLFHANYESENGVYLQQVTGEIQGDIDTAVFHKAWEHCINRHPSLRASFVLRDLPQPLQRIHQSVNLPFVWENWSELTTDQATIKWTELLEKDRRQGFSLETVPLMRLTLVKLEEQKWRFLWTHHHLILDGWSLPLVLGDVITSYNAEKQGLQPNLPRPPVYRDFITWLRKTESTAAESFWRRELNGLHQATTLGFKSAKSSDYQTLQTTLGKQTYSQLVAFARENQVTLSTLVQAAWSILLSRYSFSNEVIFGVTVSGRPPDLANSAEMVGLFINTLPLRVRLDAATPLKNWLQYLRDRTSEINQYSSSRLVDIQGWSEVPRGQPLFESIVIYENYPVEASLRQNAGELAVHSVQCLEKNHYPLSLYALPSTEDLTLSIAFQNNVGDEQQRQQLIQQLAQILRRFALEQPQFVGEIGLLSKTEERDLSTKAFFQSKVYPFAPVQELFSQQAAVTPDAPAVLSATKSLTYAELESKSNQIAQALLQLGVTKETLVAVCLERHAGLLVALLGILKAGAAYVPLDPSFPLERLDFMLADSRAAVIITEDTLVTKISTTSAIVLLLDECGNPAFQERVGRGLMPDVSVTISQKPDLPNSKSSSQDLAYIIYTSGSTGKPKGVQISHGALTNLLLSFCDRPGLAATDTLVAVTTLSFDISMLELFLPLIAGARLVVADRETVQDGFKLGELLNKTQATVMQATPSTWRLLLAAGWQPKASFRALCGGEAMPVDLAASLLENKIELWNVYGPTETTIWSAVNLVKQPEDALSIGCGIANTSMYILDRALNLVPRGVIGELYIGGAGLARGYRGRPDLTADRFIPNFFSQEPGERLYCTGDLARFLPNGEIEFLGRLDDQVKIRGYRIELGDIETVLENHRSIAQAIVQPFGDGLNKKLVAYLVAKSDVEKPTPETLRAYVLEKLPDYMVPGAWVLLDAMPLTLNNKVDRRALPAPSQLRSEVDYIAPRNAIESALAEIWQEMMHISRVGVKNNFFDLGGHSLVAAQIHARMRKAFSIELSLRELFDALTIEKTALLLIAKETSPGRTEKIALAFLRMKQMTPEEKAILLQTKRTKS
ncbi:amino acid adenylation domain-containing protein (plasmid) [Nostoc sp. UHCC 0926]|uniref:non-ribosomal peptide synthetase n=1 Tax=Nostoc sp. UHCC 0926 TaxID=3025190 RepID=UPI0023615088|nr:non-ribosomal peptide synthetase [Nostoc sp. UHCC 0926]WDD36769.1 amino acid adenylation domain-containing protein [Nostoc sp. UHCC 0926]